MALEEQVYEYVKDFHDRHAQFRIARQSRIANLLVVVGVVATITLAMFMQIPAIFPRGCCWQVVLGIAGFVALLFELAAIFKLVRQVLVRFTYRSPGIPGEALEAILHLPNADKAELLRDLSQNYLRAIDHNLQSGEKDLKAIEGTTKLVSWTIAFVGLFVILWFVAVLAVRPEIGAAKTGAEQVSQRRTEEGTNMAPPDDGANGQDSGQGPEAPATQPAPSGPPPSPPPSDGKPAPMKQPSAQAKPVIIEGKAEPDEGTATRGGDE